jgi:hypothetical protein
VHDVKDQAFLVRDIHPPIFIGPDLPGMLFEEVPDEPCDLDRQRRKVTAVDSQRIPDTLLGSDSSKRPIVVTHVQIVAVEVARLGELPPVSDAERTRAHPPN